MKIMVRGSSNQGRSFVVRARRFWSCTDWKLVEVVDVKAGEYFIGVDENGMKIPCSEGADPPDVQVPWKNPTTDVMGTKMVPDPDRIGRNSYQTLVDDGRLSIKQTDSVSQEAADAGLAVARAEVSRLSDENLSLKARVAELETGEALKTALADIDTLKAQLTAQAEDASASGGKAKGKGKG